MADPHQVQIVGPVATSTPDPWRKQGDYQEEQREARERHAMFQEQHRLLLRSFRLNYILVVATVAAALATSHMAYVQWQAKAEESRKCTSQTQPSKAATKATTP